MRRPPGGPIRALAPALLFLTACSDEPASWIQRHPQQLALASLATFVLALIALPIVVAALPEDYFVRDRRKPVRRGSVHPLAWRVLPVVKNVFGVIFILAGVAMLVLPGQGMLTILLGLGLTNFPGKFRLERRIVGQPVVRAGLNQIRRKAGRPPFRWPWE